MLVRTLPVIQRKLKELSCSWEMEVKLGFMKANSISMINSLSQCQDSGSSLFSIEPKIFDDNKLT